MNSHLTASYDACRRHFCCDQSRLFCDHEHKIATPSFLHPGRRTNPRSLTGAFPAACLALLLLGWHGPALAGAQTLSAPATRPAPAPEPKMVVTSLAPPSFPSSNVPRPADPLAALAVPEAASVDDARADMIAGMDILPEPVSAEDMESPSSPSYLHFDQRAVPRNVVEAITRGASATGADPVYMMALADKESSFIPHNKARTSSAEGLFQFIAGTWLEALRSFGAKHGYAAEAAAIESDGGKLKVEDERMRAHILGLRRNAYLSALMAGEMKMRDAATLEEKLGRKISRSEFYLSHFFGVDRARTFMKLVDSKPKTRASRIFPAAARANKTLFFVKAGRKLRSLSVAEVYEKLDTMIDARLERYRDVLELRVAGIGL